MSYQNLHKVMNRWWVVVGALIIQMSLGAVYIWSVFQSPLKEVFPAWTEGDVTMPAQIVLASFALAVIFGGRLQDKFGPRAVATTGGFILGWGLILAMLTGNFDANTALIWLIVTFSIIGGIGIGMAYVCPIATCVKWFPDKRGLVTGLAVAGFGAGAFFFAPLAKGLIMGGKYQLLGASLFDVPELGIFRTFMVLGIIFLVAVVIGAQLLRNPPAGYVPAGWTPPPTANGATANAVDFTSKEMLRTPMFWLLWLTYFAGSTAGLLVIMKAAPIYQSFSIGAMVPPIAEADFKSIAAQAAMAVSILAIFNSLGRILWGKISDNLGRKMTLMLIFTICGTVMVGLGNMQTYPLYLIGISLVGLCFGGFLALYPALTADFFGTKDIGSNYGWIFSAYGAGGLFGPFLAAWLMKKVADVPYQIADNTGQIVQKTFAVGEYNMAFVVAGVICLVAAVLIGVALKKPAASVNVADTPEASCKRMHRIAP
jgi:OFA family oxalate/formate antiporter-like MFS transporter